MTTTEKNKLIAEFMQLEPAFISGRWQWSDMPYFSCSYTDKEKAIEAIAEYVKYSTSFDWLMPVVEKIESLGYATNIFQRGNKASVTIQNDLTFVFEAETKLEAVYNAVVEFILWYNQQNK